MKISDGVKFMFFSIVAFSFMHLCVKAIPNIPVHQIITLRSVFSISVCIYTLRKNNIPFWGNNKPLLILRGLVGALSLFCFFYSIKNLPLATAVTISNLIPIFALTLSAVFLKEKIKGYQWLFFFVSFAGVCVIKGFDNRVSSFDLVIALVAAFFTACAHFTVRKLRDFDHPMVIVFYFPLVTIPLIAPYTFTHWVQPDWFEWGILFLIGLFTHVGQVYLTEAYKNEEVSGVTFIYYIGIVLALGYGYFIFGETYNFQTALGIFLIISGIGSNLVYKKVQRH